MNPAIFVPYRPSSPERQRAWSYVLHQLQALDVPIVVADSEGEWNRAQAINRCAASMDDWDVAAIVDADTVQDPAELLAALHQAYAQDAAIVPWDRRHKLSPEGSERFVEVGLKGWTLQPGDLDAEDFTPPRLRVQFSGGTIVVARSAWDAAGPFDEKFKGWGHEDVAFRIFCRAFAPGGLQASRGTLVHLWHPRMEGPSEANEALKRQYVVASHSPKRLAELMGR